MKTIGIGVILLVHAALTFIAFKDFGYSGFFPPFTQSNTTQIFSDLVVSLSLVNIWVLLDLRRHQKPLYWFAAHLLGTALAGSFAPLTYLLLREKFVVSS